MSAWWVWWELGLAEPQVVGGLRIMGGQRTALVQGGGWFAGPAGSLYKQTVTAVTVPVSTCLAFRASG